MSNGNKAPRSSDPKEQRTVRPQCDGKVRNEDQTLRRCKKDGYAVNITGEFGTQKGYLCLGCVKLQKERGWKITFQLEGDKALCPD